MVSGFRCAHSESDCESDVPFHELLEHMDTSKRWSTSYAMAKGEKIIDKTCLDDDPDFDEPRKIEFDNKVFIFNFVNDSENMDIYYWIQLVGTHNEAEHYCYTLEFHGNEPHNHIYFSGNLLQFRGCSGLVSLLVFSE